MVQSLIFWYLLLGSAVLCWLLPAKSRAGFITAVSLAFVGYFFWDATYQSSLEPGGRWLHLALNMAVMLAWALLFYFVAPLAAPQSTAASVARVSASPAIARAVVAAPSSTPPLGSSTATADRPAVASRPRQRRWVFWSLVLPLIAYLIVFKFSTPTGNRGATAVYSAYLIPIGLSYFVFKLIHYAIEVARGNVRQRSLWQFFSWLFLFSTFTAGPIERFDHFLANQQGKWNSDATVVGAMRIIYGLIKKFILAEMLFRGAVTQVDHGEKFLQSIPNISTWGMWWISIQLFLYLYFDFAGYSDIAIGASRMLGLGIMENFNWPILSPNIATFWKRWHMTLAGWCTSYVYMPVLGLTRLPVLGTYAAFLVIGAWHQVSFAWIFWGMYHATGIVFYQYWSRWRREKKWTWGLVKTRTWEYYVGTVLAIALTVLFVSAGELLSCSAVHGMRDVGHLAGRLCFLNIRHK